MINFRICEKMANKADLGAMRSSHWRDIDRMALFDRLLRSDMLPARALEYMED